jgi:hypothetical protein
MYGITAKFKLSANVRFRDPLQRFFDGSQQRPVASCFGYAQVGFDL